MIWLEELKLNLNNFFKLKRCINFDSLNVKKIMKKRVLFIVDPKADFFVGDDKLPQSDKIVPIINKLIDNKKFDFIISSNNHCDYEKNSIKLHTKLNLDNIPIFIKSKKDDSYSSFNSFNNILGTLEQFLKKNNINEIYVVGMIGDMGVKDTSLDCSVFLDTYFIVDATKFIDKMNPTVEKLVKNGVMVINSNDIDIFLSNENYYENKIK